MSSSSPDPLASTDAGLLLASQRAAHTAALLYELHAPVHYTTWDRIVLFFQEDAKREQPLLDLMQSCEGGGTVLMQLIDTMCNYHTVLPYLSKLLKDAPLEARDSVGCTPLLRWASKSGATVDLEVLLQRGADINAQDDGGHTMLHHLAENQNFLVISKLATAGWLTRFDHALVNKAGETALQVAQRVKKARPTCATAIAVADLVFSQVTVWQQHVRPAMQRALSEEAKLIPDVAKLAMQYVDVCSEFKDGSSDSN